jgi:hypothetical protein
MIHQSFVSKLMLNYLIILDPHYSFENRETSMSFITNILGLKEHLLNIAINYEKSF